MISKIYKPLFFIGIATMALFFIITESGCGVYKLKDVSIPDSIKVVRVKYIENKAPYVNPTLAPALTEKLRQKIVSNTRLKQTNSENADWDIEAIITGYSFSTAGVSNQQANRNKLTVNINVVVDDKKAGKRGQPQSVSRNFEYAGSMSLQQAEKSLESEMLRDLSDDIFNRIFSNW